MKIVTEITLDLSRQGIQCSVPITQHDAGTRRVVVHLRNGSKPVILNEHDHCVLFFEEDNYDPVTVYTENGTYPNSLVYDLSPNLSLNAGEHQAVFQLFRGVENRTYSPLFVFAVSNDITNSSQVLQSPQYAAVLKAQYAAEQYALQANEDADEANAAMQAAQESAGEAKKSEEYVRSIPFYFSPADVPEGVKTYILVNKDGDKVFDFVYNGDSYFYLTKNGSFMTRSGSDIVAGKGFRMDGANGIARLEYDDLARLKELIAADLATNDDVTKAIDGLVDSAPEMLNTLGELADALENEESATAAILSRLGAIPVYTQETVPENPPIVYMVVGEKKENNGGLAHIKIFINKTERFSCTTSKMGELEWIFSSNVRAREKIAIGSADNHVELTKDDLVKLLILTGKLASPDKKNWPYFKSQLNVTKKVYMTMLNDGNYALIVDYGKDENDENENPDSDNKGRVRVTGSLLINGKEAATQEFVETKVADLVASSPDALDTLNELAAALGDDPNFATTVMTMLGNKADKVSEDELNAMLAEVLA